jgi:multiple antibiotic resistance protein
LDKGPADAQRAAPNEDNAVTSSFSQLVASMLLVVGALFPIVNPLGSAPIFLVLTRGVSNDGRAKLARMIALNGLALMVVSIFLGTHILGFFGISLPVVQVSGGLVAAATGWGLLRHSDDDDATPDAKRPCNETNYMRRAFYPLTLPLTVGPGSISAAITVGANRTEGSEWRWALIVGLLIGAVVIAVSIYLSYRFAERIAEALGDTAMNVVIRLSSFILVCIGVQIAWNGLSALLRSALLR